jgi:hypothetical protein
MSQITYRGNLASATWPLISALFGRSVIVGGPDQNFIRQLYSHQKTPIKILVYLRFIIYTMFFLLLLVLLLLDLKYNRPELVD